MLVFEKIYYFQTGAKLSLGVRELKSTQDIADKVGYDNGNEIDMYVEHFGYDIMELAELERNEKQHHNSIESSDDEYYGSDDCVEIENVDFQIEGESVVIKNISTHDPFLNRLCSARIMFRGPKRCWFIVVEMWKMEDVRVKKVFGVKDTTEVTTENIDEAPASETTDVSIMVKYLSAPAVDKGKGKNQLKIKPVRQKRKKAGHHHMSTKEEESKEGRVHCLFQLRWYFTIFTSFHLKYNQGQMKELNDTNFDEMSYEHIKEIALRLIPHACFEKIYYFQTGAKLSLGVRELKSTQDIADKVGYDNGNEIDMYVEHFGECMEEQARGQARIDVEQERFDQERREEREWEEKQNYFNPANFREDSIKEAPFNQAYAEVFIPSIHSQPTQQQRKESVEDQASAPKKKRGRPPSHVDGIRIYHKNRRRSERIANMKENKAFQFDKHGTGSTPDKAFDVDD
nr:splicing factor [Tanacetum cinerariifolium]